VEAENHINKRVFNMPRQGSRVANCGDKRERRVVGKRKQSGEEAHLKAKALVNKVKVFNNAKVALTFYPRANEI
jgi:hypothetical protein